MESYVHLVRGKLTSNRDSSELAPRRGAEKIPKRKGGEKNMKKQAKILAIILALAFVLAVPGLATACGPRWQEKPDETIAQGAVSHYGYGVSDGTTLVIKAEVEWSDFWNVHTGGMLPQPPAPEVNFHHDMVLVAIAGTRATTGYSISFESLYERQRGHVTLANYREMAPGANCPVGQMTTSFQRKSTCASTRWTRECTADTQATSMGTTS